MGFLNFLSSLFTIIAAWLQGSRDKAVRESGKVEAEKESLANTLSTVAQRNEAINDQPKTSYSGEPSVLIEWVRKQRESNKK